MTSNNKILTVALCIILIITYSAVKSTRKNNTDLTDSITVVKSTSSSTSHKTYSVINPNIFDNFDEKKREKTFVNSNMILSQGMVTHKIDIANEVRDSEWADKTQEIIKLSLSFLPHIKPSSTNIICRSSMCEATGQIEQEVDDSEIEALSKSISSTDYIQDNLDLNALPVKSVIKKSVSQTTFKIEFSRVRK